MKARVRKVRDHYVVDFLNDIDLVIGSYPVTDVEIDEDVKPALGGS